MNDARVLSVTMLGGCRITYGEKAIDKKTMRSKRIWALLEFLITHRSRTVTSDELIELLYPEDKSEQPLSALKTLVHRAREILNQLEYIDGKQLIQQGAGGYFWNPEISMYVDVEEFDRLITETVDLDDKRETRLKLRLQAIDLYRGDFLPDSALETWVVPISSYYRYQYMSLVKLSLEELAEGGEYSVVVSVAQGALAIDPYEEFLYYYLILALAYTNQIAAAKAQYDSMTKLFYSEFGVTPSENLQRLYKKLAVSSNGVEMDLGIIKAQMKEHEEKTGAFFCEYEFFKDIYRLEARSAARKGVPIHICLMSIDGKDGAPLSQKLLDRIMKAFSEIIKSTLRSGDVYSRYSISQYVILLPQANYQNSEMVMERLMGNIRQSTICAKASITYSLQAIDLEG